MLTVAEWAFEKNHGQLHDSEGKPMPGVEYFGQDKNMQVYCLKDRIAFVFNTISQNSNESSGKVGNSGILSFHRIDMVLKGLNTGAKILAEGHLEEYKNYYTDKVSVHGVSLHSRLVYKNVYPNVDLVLYTRKSGLKYDFVVYPGGDPASIQLLWEGTDKKELLKGGGMRYFSSLGTITEDAPYSYVNSSRETVASSFGVRNGFTVFNVGDYNKSETLVIDPTLSWSTYLGGSGQDIAFAISAGDDEVYATGQTQSFAGIGTTGAHQTNFAGDYDGYIIKFDESGARIWSTYYGGSAFDEILCSTLDPGGLLYVAGKTTSTSGIATLGTHQTTNSGGGDIFIAAFTQAGQHVWGTYYGGTADDNPRSMIINNTSVYVTGRSRSTSGIATSGAYQTTGGGSTYDGYLAKFSTAGNLDWATYIGGSGEDESLAITADKTGNILVGGFTASSGLATSGAYQVNIGGSEDAFIARFNSSGNISFLTYYGGTASDRIHYLLADGDSTIYINGMTGSSGMATNGTHQTSLSGGVDAMLGGFNSNTGSRIWGTYFGGIDEESGRGLYLSDNTLYFSGYTRSTSGISTPDAYQITYGGNYDAYLGRIDLSGITVGYATYFGGSGDDRIFQLAGDDNAGKVYFSGLTSTASAMATSGAFQTNHGGSTYDAYVTAFSIGTTGIPEFESLTNVKVYPNPTETDLFIEIRNGERDPVNVTIYDLSGRQLSLPFKEILKEENHTFRYRTSTLASGTYLIKVSHGSQFQTFRFIKL